MSIEHSEPDLLDLLRQAQEYGASDIHLAAEHPPLARINGYLTPLQETSIEADTLRSIIQSALTEVQRSRLEETLELDFILEVDGLGRFRGNAHYARGQMGATLRLIPGHVQEILELGHEESVLKICDMDAGLVLITGTTGSGKSTTLSSLVQTIAARRAGMIMTIEDPIEFILHSNLALIKQREIGHDTRSHLQALKHVLRQDPDIIVISEMRDRDTIQAAITAAETGHLVISTLHTIDAPKSIDRMVDVFPADQQNQIITQLASTLRGVLSQRLLPGKADGDRVLASELMFINDGIRACIRDRKPQQILGLMEIGKREGMFTLDHSLAKLVESGQISHELASMHARDPAGLPAEPKERKKLFGL
ncbi:MAG: PilT/PilU family type 4a pilus ATPase [Verrucomicrobiota bacterium]